MGANKFSDGCLGMNQPVIEVVDRLKRSVIERQMRYTTLAKLKIRKYKLK